MPCCSKDQGHLCEASRFTGDQLDVGHAEFAMINDFAFRFPQRTPMPRRLRCCVRADRISLTGDVRGRAPSRHLWFRSRRAHLRSGLSVSGTRRSTVRSRCARALSVAWKISWNFRRLGTAFAEHPFGWALLPDPDGQECPSYWERFHECPTHSVSDRLQRTQQGR